MPVEIKELHIRLIVSGKAPEAVKSGQNAAKDEDHGGHGGDKDEIVAECVEQVLQILQAKKER
jgi:hypothetical protein